MLRTFYRLATILVIALTMLVVVNHKIDAETPPTINWIDGPATVDLGDVAQIGLANAYSFANGADTKKLLTYVGEPTEGTEIGTVVPKDQTLNWGIFFNYDAVGYVRDDEGAKLDNQAILESIKNATNEANKTRVKNGLPALNVIGWAEEPYYDSSTHNLTWAVLGEDAVDHNQLVNYNTRLLGRGGYISVNLVTGLRELATYKADVNAVISKLSWKSGQSYSEWRQGDNVAEIGLTALVAGTAGAVAAKTGILGKIWYFLVAGVLAVVSFFARLFRRIFHSKEKPDPYNDNTQY